MKKATIKQYQSALNDGYSPTEIHSFLQNNGYDTSAIPQPAPEFSGLAGAAHGLSGILRGFNAGIVPDGVAAASMLPKEIQTKASMMQGTPRADALQEYTNAYKANPFADSGLVDAAASGNGGKVAQKLGQDGLGALSWIVPGGRGLAGRGVAGVGQGVLQGASQDGATPQSIATNAVTNGALNMVMPGASNVAQSLLGRSALGKGGEKFGDIVKQVGGIYGMDSKGIANKLYQKMDPIRTQFNDLLANSKGNLTKRQVFGERGVGSGQVQNGFVKDILDNMPFSQRGQANDYLGKLGGLMDDIHSQYLTEQGYHPNLIPAITQNREAAIPPIVLDRFRQEVGKEGYDPGQKGVSAMAQGLYGKLRGQAAQDSSNPAEYNKLQGLKSAGATMSQHLSSGQNSNLDKVLNLGTTLSLPVSLGMSVLSGNPGPALLAAGAKVARNPVLAANAISTANSPFMRMLGRLGIRGTANTASGLQTNQ